ncbi:hypothetical protein GOV13_02805 [Candidatus Pacearchaeota archaeon]|nr:hypothetical protein [Candidatus Pacearchaeota archaeon]
MKCKFCCKGKLKKETIPGKGCYWILLSCVSCVRINEYKKVELTNKTK